MEKSLEEAKAALSKSQEDIVFLDALDIKTTHPLPKLTHCYLSPYPIQRKVSQNAYQL